MRETAILSSGTEKEIGQTGAARGTLKDTWHEKRFTPRDCHSNKDVNINTGLCRELDTHFPTVTSLCKLAKHVVKIRYNHQWGLGNESVVRGRGAAIVSWGPRQKFTGALQPAFIIFLYSKKEMVYQHNNSVKYSNFKLHVAYILA